MISRSRPEVTLQAQDRSPDVLAGRRDVVARRTAVRACEVEQNGCRVELRLETCIEHFEADPELRSRVPDRPETDCPDIPVRVAANDRAGREARRRAGSGADRTNRRRTEDVRRGRIIVCGSVAAPEIAA